MSNSATQQKFDIALHGATLDSAYAAVLAAVGNLKTKKVTKTAAAHMVSFRTKGRLRSAGQLWNVQVVDNDGTPHIVATAALDGITGLDFAAQNIARTADAFFQDAAAYAVTV